VIATPIAALMLSRRVVDFPPVYVGGGGEPTTTTTEPETTTTATTVPSTGNWTYGEHPADDALIVGIPVLVFLIAVLVTYTVAR
jgi:hypothetical protein